MANIGDLHRAIENSGIPIYGISGDLSDLDKVRIDFKGSATSQQKLEAKNIVLSFDSFQEGQDELTKLVASLEQQSVLNVEKFELVYLKIARAKLLTGLDEKKRLCSEIQQMLES